MANQRNKTGDGCRTVYRYDGLRHILTIGMACVLIGIVAGLSNSLHLPWWVVLLQSPLFIFVAASPFLAFSKVYTETMASEGREK